MEISLFYFLLREVAYDQLGRVVGHPWITHHNRLIEMNSAKNSGSDFLKGLPAPVPAPDRDYEGINPGVIAEYHPPEPPEPPKIEVKKAPSQ